MVRTPLQPFPRGSGPSQEVGQIGLHVIGYDGILNDLDGWDSTPGIKSPRVPPTAIAIGGTDWESSWGASPNMQTPYAHSMLEDQLSLELSTLMDAFVEESAMEQPEDTYQSCISEGLDRDLT